MRVSYYPSFDYISVSGSPDTVFFILPVLLPLFLQLAERRRQILP